MSKMITLHADDISCPHCAMTIRRELSALAGVLQIDVDVPTKTVTLEYADADVLAKAKALLDEIGYPATEIA
jgi:copper chaperone CopZ